MQKNKAYCELRQCRVDKLLYLFFVAVFMICTIFDAPAGSLCFSSIPFNDLNDPVIINNPNRIDNRNFVNALKASKRLSNHYLALLRQASIKDEPVFHIRKLQISVNDIKSSQSCPPVSSDLAPPLV